MISEEEKFFITELLKEDIEILEEDYILGKAGKSILAREIKEGLNLIEKQNKEAELKDKIIDIMAEMFLTIAKDIPGTIYHYLEKDGFSLQQCLPCHKQEKDKNWTCAECFKEYFKRKAEDNE